MSVNLWLLSFQSHLCCLSLLAIILLAICVSLQGHRQRWTEYTPVMVAKFPLQQGYNLPIENLNGLREKLE